MPLAFDDDELEGQLQRTLSHAYERAADIGEALAVAARITPGDDDSWHREWLAAAVAARAAADHSRDRGHRQSATDAYLRAAEYFRQAMFYLRADLDDPRLQTTYRDLRDAFRQALPGLPGPAEQVAIPYQTTALNGYFLRPPGPATRRPTILFPMGYDAPAEDGYLYAAPALRRGYNVLIFEGPGQGGVLYEQRLALRPDFETVLTPVVDHALNLTTVDPDRVVLFGRSFAGYLAPRGATAEHRIAALVCDPGQVDLGASIAQRVPAQVLDMVTANDPQADALLAPMLQTPAARRLWRPRMAAHDTATLRDYLRELMRYTLADRAADITCPTLVTEAEGDFAAGQSRHLFDLLTCPKTFHEFTAQEGAHGHMAGLAQQLWNGFVFDWLDETLGR